MRDFQAAFTYTDGVAFPNTAAINSTTPTSKDGTEFKKVLVDDLWGFMQAAVDGAGLVPSGSAEAAGASQILEALTKIISPTGKIDAFAMSATPTGWLACDGSAISRTTYADLFAIIGDDYGVGDGSTTFNIPDLRGEFLRGQDSGAGIDPDAAGRLDRGDGTTGDNVGTKQADAFASHTHGYNIDNGVGATSTLTANRAPGTVSQSIPTGGNETRPRNVYVVFAIKI